MTDFIEARDNALRSLELDTILQYCLEWNVPIPDSMENVWAGVHKARLEIPSFSEDEKNVSRQWLKEHGYSTVRCPRGEG